MSDFDALVCPDCIVGEPHACPLYGQRRNFPRDDPPPPRYLADERMALEKEQG